MERILAVRTLVSSVRCWCQESDTLIALTCGMMDLLIDCFKRYCNLHCAPSRRQMVMKEKGRETKAQENTKGSCRSQAQIQETAKGMITPCFPPKIVLVVGDPTNCTIRSVTVPTPILLADRNHYSPRAATYKARVYILQVCNSKRSSRSRDLPFQEHGCTRNSFCAIKIGVHK